MPLFICEKCFCIENTALGRYWTKDSENLWSEEDRGKALCSECEPTHYKDGSVNSDGGKWHGKFTKAFPTIEEIRTDCPHAYINKDRILEIWRAHVEQNKVSHVLNR